MARKGLLTAFVVVAIGAVWCGSSNSSGSGLCDKAQTAANNLNTKLAGCLPAGTSPPSSGIPTGQTCTNALAQCNANDQQIISNFLDCVNALPNCTTSTATQFENAVNACGTNGPAGLSTSCQNATGANGGTDGGTTTTDGGTGGTAASSCNYGNGVCIDYSSGFSQSTVQAACPSPYTYSTAACPTSGRVGTCTVGSGGQTEQIRLYAPFTTQIGQQSCSGGTLSGGSGTWTNG